MNFNNKKLFWDDQASKGKKSGSQDLLLNQLEQKIIISKVRDCNPKSILEIGCGDGNTALMIKKELPKIKIEAFDFSDKMIDEAKKNASINSIDIDFFVHDMNKLNNINKKYDMIISKRALINLDSYNQQIVILNDIYHLLKSNGKYLMCESSKKGLQEINNLRLVFDLERIEEPWHNTYIDEEKLDTEDIKLTLFKKVNFSSTYYFLSRVVNAHISKLDKLEPDYNSEINRMALKTPSFGNLSQSLLWIWNK